MQEADAQPALWLRGLLPTGLAGVPQPWRHRVVYSFGDLGVHGFDVDWFTDGSGGVYASVPLLRR
eukprot:6197073-Lingulodinium_polyedra.AAC.1